MNNPTPVEQLIELHKQLAELQDKFDDVIQDLNDPEIPTPPEIVEEFLDRLEGFDADDLEQFLFYLHKSLDKAATAIIEQSGDFAMQRASVHVQLAMKAWQQRKGN